MANEAKTLPLISSSPQIHAPGSTPKVMAAVALALVPAGVWSVYLFGWRALAVVLVAIAASVATEGLLNLVFKRPSTLLDGSALVTGILIGYNMPPSIPLAIPAIASVFAIAVVKWSFGGLGGNWMNPALAGRVFVFFSWTGPMSRWTLPRVGGADAVTGATPLGSVKLGLADLPAGADGPIRLLESRGVPVTYGDLFFGRIPGCIGEVSALLLIVGALALIILKVVNLDTTLSYLGSFALLIWIFDGRPYGGGFFTGDVLFHLLAGGVMLGALFMATDLVTSPMTPAGRVIYGLGCGFLTFLIRRFGSFPEGVSLAILFMNIFVPLIDRFVKPRLYGHPRKREAAA